MINSNPIRNSITTSEYLTDVRARLAELFRSHSPDFFRQAADEVVNEIVAGVTAIGTNQTELVMHGIVADDLPGEEGRGRLTYLGRGGAGSKFSSGKHWAGLREKLTIQNSAFRLNSLNISFRCSRTLTPASIHVHLYHTMR